MIVDQFKNSTVDEIKHSRDAMMSVLRQAGSSMINGNSVRCPFCDDTRPSGGVYEKDGFGFKYKCHKCGKQGSIIDVLAWSDRISPEEVIKRLNTKQVSYPLKKTIYKTIEELKDAVLAISHATSIEHIYKYTNPDSGNIDMYVFRCITSEGKTFRPACPVNDGFLMESPQAPRPIYNRTRIRENLTVVVVEGEKCVHALAEFGIVATTSPGGYANGKYADWSPLYNKNVIIWPDNDEPGRKYASDVERILLSLPYPPQVSMLEPTELELEQKEDAADFVEQVKLLYSDQEDRYNTIKKALEKARPRGYAGALHTNYQAIINGKLKPVHFPHSCLTKLTSALIPKTITMVCGNPGASKSLLLLQWATAWVEQGIKTIVCELEKDTVFHLRRVHAQKSGTSELTDNEWVENNHDRVSELYAEHEGFLNLMGNCIYDGNNAQSSYDTILDWIIEKAKLGYRVIAVDPITILDSSKDTFKDQQKFIQGLNDKVMRQYDCSVILIVHPTKNATFPGLDSLAGSTAFSRFVDTVLWLDIHDSKYASVLTSVGTTECEYNRTIIILKARNGKGSNKKIACYFDPTDLTLRECGVVVKEKKNNNGGGQ